MLTSKKSTRGKATTGPPEPNYKIPPPPPVEDTATRIILRTIEKGKKEGKTEKEIVESIESQLEKLGK